MLKPARIGVCISTVPPRNRGSSVRHPEYLREILEHAGLFFEEVPREQLIARAGEFTLLLIAGDAGLSAEDVAALEGWVRAGGALVGIGSTSGAEALFGVTEDGPEETAGWGLTQPLLGEAYLRVAVPDHPVTRGLHSSLHIFNGLAVLATDGTVLATVLDAHGRATERAGVVERPLGAGRCLLLAADIPGSVVFIQQGLHVDQDGIPAPDFAGGVSDQLLKAEDGMPLDWHFDRDPIEGLPTPAFLHPIADELRALLLQAIFHCAREAGAVLPVLWYYPRALPALGHISHDTDGNDAALGEEMLRVVDTLDIRTTWCVIMPGYPRALYDAIRESGHEIALHYDAMGDPGDARTLSQWGETYARAQHAWLLAATGLKGVATNKNHYTRWEGRLEFFEWCVRLGIQAEQSRGPSKLGCTGFPFGSAHPWRPIRDDGSFIDVLEVCFQSQDLVIFAPPITHRPLVDQCVAHHGIVHLIFHPAHIAKEGVADALRTLVAYGRERGIEWWTCERINAWERARRRVRLHGRASGVDGVAVYADTQMEGATLLFLQPRGQRVTVRSGSAPVAAVTRYGFEFVALTADLAPEAPLEIEFIAQE
jgi:hypothetical protein